MVENVVGGWRQRAVVAEGGGGGGPVEISMVCFGL